MFCCFKKTGRLFNLGERIEVKLPDGTVLRERTLWTGTVESEKGQFMTWLGKPNAHLVEIEADAIATSHQNQCGIWAQLPREVCLGAVVLGAEKDPEGKPYRPVKIFTRPALELESYLKNNRYPLVGRLSGDLVFRRSQRDLVITADALKSGLN